LSEQAMADEELPKCSTELELISTSLEHSWNWFKSHADQRLTITRFAILVLGATGAGVGYLEKDHEYFFCALLSIFGAIAAYCFLRLDVRTLRSNKGWGIFALRSATFFG
jgi:hypothetical protein